MDFGRRRFFTHVGRGLAATVWESVDALRGAMDTPTSPQPETGPRKWLRPPGALPEDRFGATCTRCTACQEACPYQSIRRLGPEWGADSGTPAIIPAESPCYLCADMPCITSCEPGALLWVTPSDATMGKAVLDRSACYVSQNQPCDYCVARCPLSESAIGLGADGVPVISDPNCTGCGVCDYLCPADAISIVPNT